MEFKTLPKAYRLTLEGNPEKPEKQTTIISFPGGFVEITRTTDNKYWAHIKVNDDDHGGYKLEGTENFTEKIGKIEKIRIDTSEGVKQLDCKTDHFAVLISVN